MKIKSGFMLREIAGQWVVVPLGARTVEFNAIMSLTESGALLWKRMVEGAEESDLLEALLSEYDVEEAVAMADVKDFVLSLTEKEILA